MKLGGALKLTAGMAITAAMSPLVLADAEIKNREYSNTNVQLGYSWDDKADYIYGSGSESKKTENIRLEHQSTYRYGQNYFYIDNLHSTGEALGGGEYTGTSGSPLQTSRYQNFLVWNTDLSLSKVSGTPIQFGPVSDVALSARIEHGSYYNYRGFGLGGSVFVDVPGFDMVELSYWRRQKSDEFVFGGAPEKYADTNLWGLTWRTEWEMLGRKWNSQAFIRYQQGNDEDGRKRQYNRWFIEPEIFVYPFKNDVLKNLAVGLRLSYLQDDGPAGIYDNFAGTHYSSKTAPWLLVKLDLN